MTGHPSQPGSSSELPNRWQEFHDHNATLGTLDSQPNLKGTPPE
jgi:hypothetical protein